MTFFTNIWKIITQYGDVFFLTGVSHTLLLAVITVGFGVIIGLALYFMRKSRFTVVRGIGTAIVGVIRGTPMLLQLYVGYFLVPKILPFNPTPFLSVAIALCINSGCYVSEIFRSGIQAVDPGQTEAARSLGLTSRQTMQKIVLPQAVKNILPALGNEFIMIVKDTSLASTFFIGEVMTSYAIVKGQTYLTFECLTIVAIIYFVLTFILTKVLGIFERRLQAND